MVKELAAVVDDLKRYTTNARRNHESPAVTASTSSPSISQAPAVEEEGPSSTLDNSSTSPLAPSSPSSMSAQASHGPIHVPVDLDSDDSSSMKSGTLYV